MAVEFHQINVIKLNLALCLRAAELPPIHKDPCDRFIIAAALNMAMPVVTADHRFADYGVVVLE
jgi:PIN domain nuclease of toxin-antitoxin system